MDEAQPVAAPAPGPSVSLPTARELDRAVSAVTEPRVSRSLWALLIVPLTGAAAILIPAWVSSPGDEYFGITVLVALIVGVALLAPSAIAVLVYLARPRHAHLRGRAVAWGVLGLVATLAIGVVNDDWMWIAFAGELALGAAWLTHRGFSAR